MSCVRGPEGDLPAGPPAREAVHRAVRVAVQKYTV